MTTAGLDNLRSCLHEVYATQPAVRDGYEVAALVYPRGIRPVPLQPSVGSAVGFEYGELTRPLLEDDCDAEGMGIGPERAVLVRSAGVAEVRQGEIHTVLTANQTLCAAMAATDQLAHLAKPNYLEILDGSVILRPAEN